MFNVLCYYVLTYVVVKTSYTFYIKQIFTVQNTYTYLTSIIELEIQILLLRQVYCTNELENVIIKYWK